MFNNGYNSFYPYQSAGYKQGLFSSLKGKFNWSGILSNTQKTLNIINQAIPVFYQIKPIWSNAKTVFKIIGAMKDDDNNNKTNSIKNYNKSTNSTKNISKANNNSHDKNTEFDNSPSFFL